MKYKKTALQWFIEQIENHNGVTRAGFQKCIDEALQMEKEQILNAFWNGDNSDCNDEQYSKQIAEYYYNETYLNR
jgi:hypothetical protein